MRASSAWVPSIRWPRIQPPPLWHWPYMPWRQYRQRPQAEMQETRTRSPWRTFSTASPVSTTVPTASWPRVRPSSQLGTSPFEDVQVGAADGGGVDLDDRVAGMLQLGVRLGLPLLAVGSVVDERLHGSPPAVGCLSLS